MTVNPYRCAGGNWAIGPITCISIPSVCQADFGKSEGTTDEEKNSADFFEEAQVGHDEIKSFMSF